jgi:hypothetical protein
VRCTKGGGKKSGREKKNEMMRKRMEFEERERKYRAGKVLKEGFC